jgi:hypothetical protein
VAVGVPLVTCVFVALVVAVAAVDGALSDGRTSPAALERWSSTALTAPSRPWRVLTSIPLTSGLRMTAGMAVVIAALFGLAEHVVGWRTALVAGLAGSVAATLVCDVALVAMRSPTAHALDFGPSAVTAGAAGALARRAPVPLAVAVAVVSLNGLVLHHQLPDAEHLVAFVVGLGAPQP